MDHFLPKSDNLGLFIGCASVALAAHTLCFVADERMARPQDSLYDAFTNGAERAAAMDIGIVAPALGVYHYFEHNKKK